MENIDPALIELLGNGSFYAFVYLILSNVMYKYLWSGVGIYVIFRFFKSLAAHQKECDAKDRELKEEIRRKAEKHKTNRGDE